MILLFIIPTYDIIITIDKLWNLNFVYNSDFFSDYGKYIFLPLFLLLSINIYFKAHQKQIQ